MVDFSELNEVLDAVSSSLNLDNESSGHMAIAVVRSMISDAQHHGAAPSWRGHDI